MLTAGYARSASSQDNIPLPPPNPFRTAAPAANPSETAAPPPNSFKAAAPAANQDDIPVPPPNPFKNAAPAPIASETAAPAPNPSKTATPAPIPSETAAPAPNPSKTATPAPNPSKTATPAPIPSETAAPEPDQYKTAAGFWQETDDQGRVGAWFLFVEKNGLYEGRFVKLFKQPGEQQQFQTCEKCTGDQKDAPMLGLTLVKGMKRNGNKYDGGTILDPRDGTVYHAQMELSADGLELSVRGYLGIPLLGQTQVWTRLPDDAMAPADIPEESFAPVPTQE
jgi:uncharacterized protein (DUF2147 family)